MYRGYCIKAIYMLYGHSVLLSFHIMPYTSYLFFPTVHTFHLNFFHPKSWMEKKEKTKKTE